MPSRIVVFAGAGASKAVNAEQFPTTIEFFERLPKAIKGHKYFQIVMDYMETRSPSKQYDIEQVLWVAQEFYKLFDSIANEDGLLGYAVNKNILTAVQHNYGFGQLPIATDEMHQGFEDLISRINQQVYDLYADEPHAEELSSNWTPLIENLVGVRERLDIFTTNYDSVIEAALIHGAFESRKWRGIEGNVRQFLNLDYWRNDDLPGEVLLTKLHGSLDWKFKSKGIAVGDALFTGDHGKQAIIYPGFKGVSEASFFAVFHEYLRRSIREADAVIFIGFAFRDEHINEIFRDELERETKIISLNPDPKIKLPIRRVSTHYISEGFGSKAVDDLSKLVRALPMVV